MVRGRRRADERPISGYRQVRGGLGRAVRPRSIPALWSSAGTESGVRLARPVRAPQANVEASSCEGSGLRPGVCRDARSELTAGNPSGTEVSNGPADSCRPQGRGVEEASGTPRTGTARQPPASNHSYRTFCTGSRRWRLPGKNFDEKDTAGLPQEDSRCSSSNAPAHFVRGTSGRPLVPRSLRSRGETPRFARRMLTDTESVNKYSAGRERSERPVATDD